VEPGDDRRHRGQSETGVTHDKVPQPAAVDELRLQRRVLAAVLFRVWGRGLLQET